MSGDGTESRRILVDSSVWIDVLRGHDTPQTQIFEKQAFGQILLTADLILCEVLRGCKTDSEFNGTLWRMTEIDVVTISDPDIAIKAATNYRSLRGQGITVRGTIDALIATWCIENNAWLLHSDRDFDAFEEYLGLTVAH